MKIMPPSLMLDVYYYQHWFDNVYGNVAENNIVVSIFLGAIGNTILGKVLKKILIESAEVVIDCCCRRQDR